MKLFKGRMRMNVFFREMKANRKSLIIWSIGVILLIAGGMGKYAAFSSTGQSAAIITAQLPRSIQAVLGTGAFDLSKASGFYGVLFLYLALMAAVHAVILGATIISKEERDRTSEFLFVKPVSRNKIIASKLMAALINLIIFNLVTLAFSIITVGYYSKGEDVTSGILKLTLGLFFMQLIFMFIGTGTASLSKKPNTAPSMAAGVLLFAFVLNVAVDLDKKISFLKFFTPFKYFNARDLMYGGRFEPVFLFLSLIIVGTASAATFVFYKRKDLNV